MQEDTFVEEVGHGRKEASTLFALGLRLSELSLPTQNNETDGSFTKYYLASVYIRND
jgi:hypothetical protein